MRLYSKIFTSALAILGPVSGTRITGRNNEIYFRETGFWDGDPSNEHSTDETLKSSLVDFFTERNVSSVVDFGCGMCHYI